MLGNLPRECWAQHSPRLAVLFTAHCTIAILPLLIPFLFAKNASFKSEFHEAPSFYPSKQPDMHITCIQVHLHFLASEIAEVIATLLVVDHVPNSAAVKGDLWVF